MLALLPDVTEKNADFAEVESRDDDVESDEMGRFASWLFLEFAPLEIGLSVFLQLGSLHRELKEVVILLEVG